MCAQCDWEDALENMISLKELCEEMDVQSETGRDYIEDVLHRVEGIIVWVRKNKHCTQKQVSAIEGWTRGVKRWEH